MTYSALPHAILGDRRLIPGDVVMVAVLLRFARDKPTCWPSVRTLMAEVGRTRRTVQASLARLKAAGWLAERPADNPTGRVLVLAWRDRGAQSTALGGRSPTTPGGARPAAPESKNQEEEKCASPSGQEKGKPPGPMSPEDRRLFFAEAGWLDRPPGDLLRRLAERRLAGGPTAGAPTAGQGSPPPPSPRRRGRWGPVRAPRRLFG